MYLALFFAMTVEATAPLQLTIHPPAEKAGNASFWSGETPSFDDFLDLINPLQHIPFVSNLYQSLTGDSISTGSKIGGGALFGGPIGLVASLFDTILQNETGTDTMGNLMAAIEGKSIPALEVAQNASPPNAGLPSGFLSSSKRSAYNAYVAAGQLA